MSILVDVLLILVFLFVIAFFTKYGLSRAVMKIGNAWLSLACSFIIGPIITNFLEAAFFNELVGGGVYNTLVTLIEGNANGYNLKELFDNLPAGFQSFLNELGVSLPLLEAEFGSYTEASADIIRAMAQRIAEPCVNVISGLIGQVIGFVIPWVFVRWMNNEIRKDRIPFFRAVNYVGGGIVGVAAGYALVLGLALLTKTVFQVITAFNAGIGLMDIYNNSFVFKFITEFDTFGAIKNLFSTVAKTAGNLIG